MRKLRKILCLLLSCLMLAGLAPLTALAEGDVYRGSCGDDVNWEINTGTGVLTLSGTGAMKDYLYHHTPWDSYRDYITKVVVGSGITYIGNYSFSDLVNIVNVQLPNTVTSIGKYAFYLDEKMTCDLHDGITAIGEHAFDGCHALKMTKLPSSLTSLGNYAFFCCYNVGPAMEFPQGITNIPDGVFLGVHRYQEADAPRGDRGYRHPRISQDLHPAGGHPLHRRSAGERGLQRL